MRFAFISTLYDQPWGASEELWSQAATQLKREGHDVQASTAYWPQLPDKLAALGRHGISSKLTLPFLPLRVERGTSGTGSRSVCGGAMTG